MGIVKMKIDIHSYAFCNAAEDRRCKRGPWVVKKACLQDPSLQSLQWANTFTIKHVAQKRAALRDVAAICTDLARAVQQSILHHHFFITVGGDHSCAIGTWSGAARTIQPKGDLGLIWFDAHMDAHTFETSLSDNIHGMSVAHLLGYGEQALTQILSTHQKIKPGQLVLIGVRSFESGEAVLLKKLNVKIFYMHDVIQQGLRRVIEQAIHIVTQNTAYFGVSIDLDAIDPIDAPGVGTPASNGIRTTDFLKNFHLIAQHPKLIGAEIAEFNPAKDKNQLTEKIIVEIIRVIQHAMVNN